MYPVNTVFPDMQYCYWKLCWYQLPKEPFFAPGSCEMFDSVLCTRYVLFCIAHSNLINIFHAALCMDSLDSTREGQGNLYGRRCRWYNQCIQTYICERITRQPQATVWSQDEHSEYANILELPVIACLKSRHHR